MSESLFNRVVVLKTCNFIKKRLQHNCFPVNIAKFLRTAFFYRIPHHYYFLQKQPPEVFYRNRRSFKNFTKFAGKHLCQSLFFNKVAGRPTTLLKRIWHRCFRVNFLKFLRTPFLQSTFGQLNISVLV